MSDESALDPLTEEQRVWSCVLLALYKRFGPDNVDFYEGRTWMIGVCVDGVMVDVTVSEGTHNEGSGS